MLSWFRTVGVSTLFVFALAACDSGEPPPIGRDAGGGGVDAGPMEDAGAIPSDAGEPPEDAGSVDAAISDGDTPIDCIEGDLGRVTGEAIVRASVDGTLNRVAGACTETDGFDHIYRWEAPETADWVFDTLGSDIDTVLSVWEVGQCPPITELDCNDDTTESVQSSLRRRVEAGTALYIVVDEYARPESGEYRLTILRDVPAEETSCGDGEDDDRDGASDCDDVDCCGEVSCSTSPRCS